MGKDLPAVLLHRDQIVQGIYPCLQTGGNDARQQTSDVRPMLRGVEEGVLALANAELERPVKLSEGIAPSAGLQNRAC